MIRLGEVNLHDWIDELCDVLELEVEVDEALVAEVVKAADEAVAPGAGPVSGFLLGVAAGRGDAGEEDVEELAGRIHGLAESWDRPAGAPDPDDVDDEIPDDRTVDHSQDAYESEFDDADARDG